jgi:hypothetical protein
MWKMAFFVLTVKLDDGVKKSGLVPGPLFLVRFDRYFSGVLILKTDRVKFLKKKKI